MQARLAINAVVLVLSAGVSVQTATACSKEAVAGAVDRWTTVLAENNPDSIAALEQAQRIRASRLVAVRTQPSSTFDRIIGSLGGH